MRPATIHVSPLLTDAARKQADEVLKLVGTMPEGLTEAESRARLEKYGPNEIAQERQHGWPWRLLSAVRNPLVVLLSVLSLVSFLTGDVRAGWGTSSMVVLGVGLRFVQESRADQAATRLKAMISVTATAFRDGTLVEVPLRHIVPGDLVKLAAEDMIPADVRLLSSKDLLVVQSSLTGNSLPVEKDHAPLG